MASDRAESMSLDVSLLFLPSNRSKRFSKLQTSFILFPKHALLLINVRSVSLLCSNCQEISLPLFFFVLYCISPSFYFSFFPSPHPLYPFLALSLISQIQKKISSWASKLSRLESEYEFNKKSLALDSALTHSYKTLT